jgi:glycosyltransferase involved in cell wall biosynthesis
MLSGETIVIISDVDWEGHWVCEQQITKLLSNSNRVLYIEQTRTLLAFLRKSGGDTSILNKIRLILKGLRKLDDNLAIVSPPLMLPFKYLPLIYQINQKIRLFWVRKLFKKANINNPILITFDPDSSGLIGHLNEKLSIYYRNDTHDKRGLWFNPNQLVSKRETELIQKVDLVITLSNSLAAKSRYLNVKTFVVPNGVDLDLFHETFNNKCGEPYDISDIPHPRVGLVGMLDWRIDVTLLEDIARKQREWSIVLIGPINPQYRKMFDSLRSLKNVHFLGHKKVSKVPIYIKGLDVGLIPYKINDYTKGILSLKIFEYSALGIPTVATPMPELYAYNKIIDLAENAYEFKYFIGKRLSTYSDGRIQQLVQFSKENTWNKRVYQLTEIINRELNGTTGNLF